MNILSFKFSDSGEKKRRHNFTDLKKVIIKQLFTTTLSNYFAKKIIIIKMTLKVVKVEKKLNLLLQMINSPLTKTNLL